MDMMMKIRITFNSLYEESFNLKISEACHYNTGFAKASDNK